MRCRAVLLLGVCGCNPDVAPGVDAPPAQPTLTISGTVTERVGTGIAVPAAGVTIGADRNGAAMPIATTTTDATGAYALAIDSGGMPLDTLEASLPPLLPLVIYLSRPISEDVTASFEMVDSAALSTTIQASCHTSLKPTVEVRVSDASGAAVTDATVSSQPRALRYCTANGITYLFGATGSLTISATKAGQVIGSRTITARFGTLTLLLLGP